ncbi:hypothetical protein PG987_010922 [Apiospora arundinis]
MGTSYNAREGAGTADLVATGSTRDWVEGTVQRTAMWNHPGRLLGLDTIAIKNVSSSYCWPWEMPVAQIMAVMVPDHSDTLIPWDWSTANDLKDVPRRAPNLVHHPHDVANAQGHFFLFVVVRWSRGEEGKLGVRCTGPPYLRLILIADLAKAPRRWSRRFTWVAPGGYSCRLSSYCRAGCIGNTPG